MTIGPGMGPYPLRVKLALYTSRSQSAIGRRGCDSRTMGGDINPDDICFRPRVVEVVNVWVHSDPGMGASRPQNDA